MSEERLGVARLDLEANVVEFERGIKRAHRTADELEEKLEGVAAVSKVADFALKRVGMRPGQGAESRAVADTIEDGLRGIFGRAAEAAHKLHRVRLRPGQASESEVVGALIDRVLERLTRKAGEARRALESVRLAGLLAGRAGASGVRRVARGLGSASPLGAAVAAGVLLAPSAGPAAVGLLSAIPVLAAGGVGALGSLALAFHGVGAAIKGDKHAFDELTPPAQRFVQTVRSLHPFLQRLRGTAAANLFPGLTAGLHAALTPGTVGVLTHAVGELSAALGSAAAQWGHYFGSADFQRTFGSLMHAGARNLKVLSDAALHFTAGLGVLARAAIPFTNWMTSAIDRGARLTATWLRAKEASGALGHAMNEAKTSLRLVGHLFTALLRAVGALARALYGPSKQALRELTHGLSALGALLERNRGVIRSVASTLVTGLVTATKGVVGAFQLLHRVLDRFFTRDKANVITAVVAIGAIIAVTIGPGAAAIVGAIYAVGLIRHHWRGLVGFFKTLGREILNAFKWVWVQLERGALKAALRVVEPFSHLPSKLGGWARHAKNNMQRELAKLHPPNMDWSAAAAQAGVATGNAWVGGFSAAVTAALEKRRKHGGVVLRRGGLYVPPAKTKGKDKPKPKEPTPGSHAWYMKYLGYDPTVGTDSPHGKPPPLKDDGSKRKRRPSVVPAAVQHLESLASQEASRAAAARSRAAMKRHVDKELDDLRKADRLLHERYAHAHGQARERLFREITRVENAMRRARAELRKKLDAARAHDKNSREERLKLAVDTAKLAVESAKEGTAAYDRAVRAEETALRAEIRYYDRKAHNAKLSAEARDRALRAEIAAKKQLDRLHKKAKHDGGGAAIAQFLDSFGQLMSQFGSNVQSLPGAAAASAAAAHASAHTHAGKTNTHLHNMLHELRVHSGYLRHLVARHAFPASGYAVESARAVTG